MKPKYKNRYVLATGYPDQYAKEKRIGIRKTIMGEWLPVKIPDELFDNIDKMPLYRLVLERVKK